MYLQHFGLGDFPFIQSAKHELYFSTADSDSQSQLLHHWLDAGHGMFVIAGEQGVGRVSLAHHALDTAEIPSIERYVIGSLPLTPLELLRGLALEMGLEASGGDCMVLRHAIRSNLRARASLQHRMCILVQNANALDAQTLAFIHDLSQEHTLYLPLCHVILLTDKSFASQASKKKRSGQAREIHHIATIKTLNATQTKQYIEHRLEQANADTLSLFGQDLANLIHQQTQGKPQLINALCDKILCHAFYAGVDTLTAKHVSAAIAQLGWQERLPKNNKSAPSARNKASQSQLKDLSQMGALERSVHELVSGVTTIGRAPDCAIRLEGTQFSPYQALIVRTDEGMFIRNEGSQVPLYLNGGTVESANLGAGDCVRIGSYQFSVKRDSQGKLSLVATAAST